MKLPVALIVTICVSVTATHVRGEVTGVVTAIRNLSGVEATFVQRFLPRGYKKDQVETGTVIFGDAPASRWSYVAPEAKTFVFNGTTSWMYVPEDETVMVHRVSESEKNRLPFFVLSEPEKLSDRYDIVQRGRRTTLSARDNAALLRTITVELDADGRLASLEYVDPQGNRTTFELSGWKKAATTSGTLSFTPPPGVDVIEN